VVRKLGGNATGENLAGCGARVTIRIPLSALALQQSEDRA
jgi:hypothetical protein